MTTPAPTRLAPGNRVDALLSALDLKDANRTKLLTTHPQITADGRLLLFTTLESGHRLKPDYHLPRSAFYALRSKASLDEIPTDRSEQRLSCLIVESGRKDANPVVVPVLTPSTVNVLLNHALVFFRSWQAGNRACYALDAAARVWTKGAHLADNGKPWQPAFRGIYRKDDTLFLLPTMSSGREQVLQYRFSPANAGGLHILPVD